jgi:hypothetical protein
MRNVLVYPIGAIINFERLYHILINVKSFAIVIAQEISRPPLPTVCLKVTHNECKVTVQEWSALIILLLVQVCSIY